MITFLTFILALLILGVLLGAFRRSHYRDQDGDPTPAGLWRPAVAVILALVIAFLNPISLEVINAGHIGLKVSNVGDNRGVGVITRVNGWVFYNSWTSRVVELGVQQEHIDYEPESIITKGGFAATIKPSFNYALKPEAGAQAFQQLKIQSDIKEVENTWLKNAIVGAVNDVANLYTVDSIFNHRAAFEAEIVKEANRRTAQYFAISQLRTGIKPPEAITNAINQKTQAIQEAQVAFNRRDVAIAEAERKMAEARGDSAHAVITAAGEAEAIRRKQATITNTYIDFIKAQKWNGQMPQIVTGNSGTGLIMQLPTNRD